MAHSGWQPGAVPRPDQRPAFLWLQESLRECAVVKVPGVTFKRGCWWVSFLRRGKFWGCTPHPQRGSQWTERHRSRRRPPPIPEKAAVFLSALPPCFQASLPATQSCLPCGYVGTLLGMQVLAYQFLIAGEWRPARPV